MVSKNQIKLITGLQQKKYRLANGLFIAEGVKVISELFNAGITLESLFVTEPLFDEIKGEKSLITESELRKISALTTPNNCLAVFRIPGQKPIGKSGLVIVLDDIRDPGNFGTIIRLCDWFGVSQIVCSPETVDLYNPKVVQSTMGSIARVNVTYARLEEYLSDADVPVFGTFMDGETVYSENLPENGIVVFGNEANGISPTIEKLVQKRIAIQRFGELQKAESLNVANAAAIILSEFRRRTL